MNNRIKIIASKIYPYEKIADVGCDHGYLIIEAIKLNENIKAIAIDNKEMPLNSCKQNIIKHNYLDKVRFSLSSGIEDIDDDTECVVIAGMGGNLICEILSKDLKNVKRLILAPNKDEYTVRSVITKLGFKIVDEEIAYENNKYYQIIVCDKSNDLANYNDDELTYGPINIKKKDNLFNEYIEYEYNKYSKISNSEKISKRLEMIRRIKEC